MINDQLLQDPNTPYMSHSIGWEDEALIKPLKNEKMREKLMPSSYNKNSKSGDLLLGSRKQSVRSPKNSSTKGKLKKLFEIPDPTEQTEDQKKICDLQVQVSCLKNENTQLRMLINELLNHTNMMN